MDAPPRVIQLAAVIGLTTLATVIAAFTTGLPGPALKWWVLAFAANPGHATAIAFLIS